MLVTHNRPVWCGRISVEFLRQGGRPMSLKSRNSPLLKTMVPLSQHQNLELGQRTIAHFQFLSAECCTWVFISWLNSTGIAGWYLNHTGCISQGWIAQLTDELISDQQLNRSVGIRPAAIRWAGISSAATDHSVSSKVRILTEAPEGRPPADGMGLIWIWIFVTFDHFVEETWPDQQEDNANALFRYLYIDTWTYMNSKFCPFWFRGKYKWNQTIMKTIEDFRRTQRFCY